MKVVDSTVCTLGRRKEGHIIEEVKLFTQQLYFWEGAEGTLGKCLFCNHYRKAISVQNELQKNARNLLSGGPMQHWTDEHNFRHPGMQIVTRVPEVVQVMESISIHYISIL